MSKPYIDSPEVRNAVDEAARAACLALDETFTGSDAGGITSNFQGLLKEVLLHMLAGRSLLDGKRGRAVTLPALVLTDHDFGNPLLRGEAFVIAEHAGPDAKVLDNAERRFVPLGEWTDPFTSFDAALNAARRYCERELDELPLPTIRPVRATDHGWAFA